MKKLLVHPEALLDIRDAFAFYEHERPGLGGEFADFVYSLIDSIRAQPNIGAPTNHRSSRGLVRRRLLNRFPYSIIYVVYGASDTIEIVAVAHGKRRPGYWADRAP